MKDHRIPWNTRTFCQPSPIKQRGELINYRSWPLVDRFILNFLFANSSNSNPRTTLKCKQCIQKAVELSGATAKLYNLGTRVRKKENKIRNILNELDKTSSRMIPLRIEDKSHDNQNYIPQKTLKKTVNFEVNHSKGFNYEKLFIFNCSPLSLSKLMVTKAVAKNATRQWK